MSHARDVKAPGAPPKHGVPAHGKVEGTVAAPQEASAETPAAELDVFGQLALAFPRGELPSLGPSGWKTLLPDLQQLVRASEVPDRFRADLGVLRAELLGGPGLSAQDRALGVFLFFTAYAERFVALATRPEGSALHPDSVPAAQSASPSQVGLGDEPALLAPPRWRQPSASRMDGALERLSTEHQDGAERFVSILRELDLSPLRTPNCEPLREARELLLSGSPQAFSERLEQVQEQLPPLPLERSAEASPAPSPAAPPALSSATPRLPAEGSSPDRPPEPLGLERTGPRAPRLGRNLVWNVLHGLRATEPGQTADDDAEWKRVVVGALLVLLAVAVIVVVLVNL